MTAQPPMPIAIETGALTLRLPTIEDADRITALLQEKDIVRMLGRVPWPYSRADAVWWIENAARQANAGEEYPLVIIHNEHGLIGSCGLQKVECSDDLCVWELGYWIGKPYWRQGFVSRAANAILDWGRTALGATGFVSGHIEDNTVSGHVLRTLGFESVGTIEHYARGRDATVHAKRYVLSAPQAVAMAFNGHEAAEKE
ncbi:MAG: GNAT family N-acetyltransferase [Pseudomonadota bacterium]